MGVSGSGFSIAERIAQRNLPCVFFSKLSVTQEKWGWGVVLVLGDDMAGGGEGGYDRRGCGAVFGFFVQLNI